MNLKEEKRNLELLKSHFSGNLNLSRCRVLMNDLITSQRLIQNFTEKNHPKIPLNILLVSKSFWPVDYDSKSFSTENLPIHSELEAYRKKFETTHPLKTTQFHSNLGKVELNLTIAGKKISIECQPVHAAIISVFSKKNHYDPAKGVSLDDLADRLKAGHDYVRGKAGFWAAKGILIERERLDPIIGVEETVYFLCESFVDQEKVLQANLEDDNEQLLKSGQSRGMAGNFQKALVEGLILQILRDGGPTTQDDIMKIIKKVYKVSIFLKFNFFCLLFFFQMRRKINFQIQKEIFR